MELKRSDQADEAGGGASRPISYPRTMLDAQRIADYLAMKARLAAAIATPASGFRAPQREISEGLARSCRVDGALWTYATDPDGYAFTSPDGALSVVVSPDAARNAVFSPNELAGWLRAGGGHDRISSFVIDNWLMRAEIEGHVVRDHAVRGCWRLAT